MPTFKVNSEKPYYQDGRLVEKVKTQHNLRHLRMGWCVKRDEEEQMEYQRTELTEWYDKDGRVRKRRLRLDSFHV
jgi:hypothetical protein